MTARKKNAGSTKGLTLVELIVAFTILSLLTTMAVPLTRYKVRRDKERDLRIALDTIHRAIDNYKDASSLGMIEVKLDTEGYPESLDIWWTASSWCKSATARRSNSCARSPRIR